MLPKIITMHVAAAAMCTLSTAAMAGGPDNPISAAVRAANAQYTDVAVAVADGYGPIPCVSGGGGGSMGIHYVNGDYLMNDDNALDIARPEALMYEPQADGSLELIGVEYLSLEGPASLDGHLFVFTGEPNRYGLPPFYSLHVWAWRENPIGTFSGMNPTVSCDAVQIAAN